MNMDYEVIDKLPAKKSVIGTREILKAIKAGRVKMVIVAKNCPEALTKKIPSEGIDVKMFNGDQANLGTRLGKPFPIAMAGFE